MKDLAMFCLCLEPNNYEFIKNLGYIPVGVGEKKFDKNWLSDKSGINISKKNKNYGVQGAIRSVLLKIQFLDQNR